MAGKDVSYLEGTRLGKLPKFPGPGTYIATTKGGWGGARTEYIPLSQMILKALGGD